MSSPYYKRRRRSMIRNLWVYRKLVGFAVVLGLILWFVLTNNERVTIAFPFGLGSSQSTTGLVILLSSMVGSVATALGLTFAWAIRRNRPERDDPAADPGKPAIIDELPPPDYAAKTGDGLNRDDRWSPPDPTGLGAKGG